MAKGKTRAAAMPKMRIARPGGVRRKLVGLLVFLGLLLLVINDPTGAADVVSTVVGGLVEFVQSLRDAH